MSALLMRLKASSDHGVHRKLFATIRTELLAHERAELSELSPVLREDEQTRYEQTKAEVMRELKSTP